MRAYGRDDVRGSTARRNVSTVRRYAAIAALAGAGVVGGVLPAPAGAAPRPHAAPVLPGHTEAPGNAVPAATAIADDADGLNPLLAAAYWAAAAEAHAAGVPLSITSGHRTYGEQDALWQDGIATYGSPDAARRWVLPPEESTHVSGDAIDVGPLEGAQWLEANGNRWGLCRSYENEYWHFELETLPNHPCPPRLPDASAR
ncbi:M15 family metallopeptidase [Nocardia sp. NPDC005978]|uniref:M15 family metallopeptidase n=1 Tax=unclassified Nocardia TaxID=2637762 RepID=UPI0033A6E5A4